MNADPHTTGRHGRLASINRSQGGVPKLPVATCSVSLSGLEGDRQGDLQHHGGPERAVTLFSLERIQALQREGHSIAAGTAGENLTLAGLDWELLEPGARLRIGGLLLELTRYAPPCQKIGASFAGGAFERLSHKLHPGWSRLCARVLEPAEIAVGDAVELLAGP